MRRVISADTGVAQGADQGAAARVSAGVPVSQVWLTEVDFAAGPQVQAGNERLAINDLPVREMCGHQREIQERFL